MASKAAYIEAPTSSSILIVATHFPTLCSDIWSSFWLLAFSESRPLLMLLHLLGATLLASFLPNLANSGFVLWKRSLTSSEASFSWLMFPSVSCPICVLTFLIFWHTSLCVSFMVTLKIDKLWHFVSLYPAPLSHYQCPPLHLAHERSLASLLSEWKELFISSIPTFKNLSGKS